MNAILEENKFQFRSKNRKARALNWSAIVEIHDDVVLKYPNPRSVSRDNN